MKQAHCCSLKKQVREDSFLEACWSSGAPEGGHSHSSSRGCRALPVPRTKIVWLLRKGHGPDSVPQKKCLLYKTTKAISHCKGKCFIVAVPAVIGGWLLWKRTPFCQHIEGLGGVCHLRQVFVCVNEHSFHGQLKGQFSADNWKVKISKCI